MLLKKWLIVSGSALVAAAACTPAAMGVYKEYKEQQREKLIAAAKDAIAHGADWIPGYADIAADPPAQSDDPDEDDALLRKLANDAELGVRTPEANRQILQIAAAESAKWNGGEIPAGISSPGTRSWFSMGPSAARSEYNGSYYSAVDSGRLTAIRIDPTNPNIAYVATSGGGVWRTTHFGKTPMDPATGLPDWNPITDSLGSLAIGAMELDPTTPTTLWLGLGDAFDQQNGALVKSTDSGATWGAAIPLTTAAHPADGLPSTATNVRDLKIDPGNSNIILVATNDGFYRSTDGATFTLVDLPNAGATLLRESTWSIVYTGTDGTGSHWAVSGVYACANANPPSAGGGSSSCAAGGANYGDIWTSNDSGATWVSARAGGALPASVTGTATTDIGRIALGGGDPTNPAATVIYAEAGSLNEAASATNAVMKSVDGGLTWAVLATKSTPVINPTIYSSNCTTMDVGHAQSWYNLAVAVDPADSTKAIFGGNLCGVRTLDGGGTFENMAHWLPSGGGGTTSQGFLPYVHADWHTALISRVGSLFYALVGNDGGLFLSQNVFSASTGALVTWVQPDQGLSSHLVYAHGSGDPVFGNGDVVFDAEQDNGTRFRLLANENYVFDFWLQNWDQVIGGDGVGSAVTMDPQGQNPTYWSALPQTSRRFCRPRLRDCSKATRLENGTELANWRSFTVTKPGGDSEPFFIHYSPVNDSKASVLTHSTLNVWQLWIDANDIANFRRLSPTGFVVAGSTRSVRGLGPFASPFTYTIGGVPTRVYGVALSGGGSAVITDTGSTATVIPSAANVNVGGTGLGFINSVALPSDPANLGGTDIRQTWVVSSNGTTTLAGAPIPANIGHVYKTIDGGNTWTSMIGNGTGFDLPNVPVFVVRFDPSDPTDQTIWAGTELGVYRTTDGGQTWARYGLGLPMVRVNEFTLSSHGGLARVSTYGRGVWEIDPHGEAATAAALGDWDRNGVIDYFDVAGLTNRMGSTPATPKVAGINYDNTLDLVPGGSASLDETDLTALIAKLGSTP